MGFDYADAGASCLLADVPIESGKWVARAHRFSGRRHDLPVSEMIATLLGTHICFFLSAPVTVYRITGKLGLVPAAEVSVTDLLRLLVREGATDPQVRGWLECTHQIIGKSNEIIAAAASQLTNAFRALVVDRKRPHAVETMSFWRYVPDDDLANFMWHLSGMLTPEARERVDEKVIVTFYIH